jgi:hypothetical protein
MHVGPKKKEKQISLAADLFVVFPENHVWFEDWWMVASLCDE